jgi:hypothetical protein
MEGEQIPKPEYPRVPALADKERQESAICSGEIEGALYSFLGL